MFEPRVIIDTDPGIDDSVAILFALLSGQFQIEAVTTCFGNCPVETGTRNALRLLEMAGCADIPVYRGAGEPLVRRRLDPGGAAHVHGENGFGNVSVTPPRTTAAHGYAAHELVRRVVNAPGEITILALAPLTNLALAVRLEPEFARSVKQVIYMGGIVSGPGNVSRVATANVMNDAEAAQIVLDAQIHRLIMVGQDVTRKTRILDDRRQRMWTGGGEISTFLYNITEFYAKAYSKIEPHHPGFPAHDLLVMVYALRPELFDTKFLRVDIETEGRFTTGMTVADLRSNPEGAPNVDVCLDANQEGILDFLETVMRENLPGR